MLVASSIIWGRERCFLGVTRLSLRSKNSLIPITALPYSPGHLWSLHKQWEKRWDTHICFWMSEFRPIRNLIFPWRTGANPAKLPTRKTGYQKMRLAGRVLNSECVNWVSFVPCTWSVQVFKYSHMRIADLKTVAAPRNWTLTCWHRCYVDVFSVCRRLGTAQPNI